MNKTCTICKEEKELNSFYLLKSGLLEACCKSCHIMRSKEWRDNNREKHRATRRKWKRKNVERHQRDKRKHALKKFYELSLEDYEKMLNEQNGCCAICGSFPNGKRPHVDHSHHDGKNRSLLCFKCNSGLGFFNDDPNLMCKAARYVECHLAT